MDIGVLRCGNPELAGQCCLDTSASNLDTIVFPFDADVLATECFSCECRGAGSEERIEHNIMSP
jgi:hypothetical protein